MGVEPLSVTSDADTETKPPRTTERPVRQLPAMRESSIQHMLDSTYTPECPGGTASNSSLGIVCPCATSRVWAATRRPTSSCGRYLREPTPFRTMLHPEMRALEPQSPR